MQRCPEPQRPSGESQLFRSFIDSIVIARVIAREQYDAAGRVGPMRSGSLPRRDADRGERVSASLEYILPAIA